ncbi:phytoene desaturase family protein [Lysinibacillus capsici]|uniref:phytoene desaturase family protein n=1 Tax=Lysinibacillus capsici TaxID=2115968 RepID=UPI0028A25F40|nr:phytoene desaturase family protein [Lysinibacillus capsici]
MKKEIIVIGAGPGGLASAMLLSAKGFNVKVYEKQPYIGGRTSEIKLGEYKFDMGPTFLNMLYIIEEIFELAGKNIHNYIDLVNLDPMYELIFHDKRIKMTRDREEMIRQINELFPGNEGSFEKYMKETNHKLEALVPVLQASMNRYTDLLQPKVLKALGELEIGRSLIDTLSRFYKQEELQLAFTFQAKYLGMSPWESPGAFSILSFIEHAYGVYHITGGINKLTQAMAKVVRENGGEIYTNCGVSKLWLDGRKVKGVILDNGEKIASNEVIINSDFGHAMTHLVEPGVLKKYTKEKLEKKKYSCSTFMLYLGVNKKFDLPHHTIWFAKNYRKNVEEITNHKLLSDDPSIYIQNAVVTDPTVAPQGKSTLYVLAPVPNNFSHIEWDTCEQDYRNMLIGLIEDKLGIENLEQYIEEEHIISPKNWEENLGVYKGATFNLGHQLTQMLTFRPHNKFEELKNSWLVGGGTHPGSGLPIILESARITSNGILQKHGLAQLAVKPLPKIDLFNTELNNKPSEKVMLHI